ncbi:MAG: serine/threonine-protein kinase [Planctomycetota bacterium]
MPKEELGPYQLVSDLGSGAMGTVHLAIDADGEQRALKIIHRHLLQTKDYLKRFLREAEIGQQVNHENVVRTLAVGATERDGSTAHYLVMEYVEGQTLREMGGELGALPESLCRHIGLQIARGLSAIHNANVIHRDLKPENVLITNDHVVKIMDLGVARLVGEALRLSASGAFFGSVLYAAPEQWDSEAKLDGRVDLYALGVILHELVTGVRPRAESPDAVRNIRPVAEINPQVSPFFEQVVSSLVANHPSQRMANAELLCEVLTEGEDSAWWRERVSAMRADHRQPLRRIRVPRATALYGRNAELDRLMEWYGDAERGDGRMVLIRGEAGIGKTRLVDEFIGRLRKRREDFNFLFGSYLPGGAATGTGAFSTAYREHFGADRLEEVLAEYLHQTPLLVPAIAALLRGDPAPPDEESLTKDSMQAAFLRMSRALAEQRPTIVFIDDLQFAPAEGLALFASLAHGLVRSRILVIGAARRGVDPEWIGAVGRLENVRRLVLPRLGSVDVDRILHDAFGSKQLARDLGWRIAEKTDGNPYFVFEVLDDLRQRGRLSRSEQGVWEATNPDEDIAVPATVKELIRARIAQLDSDEQEYLQLASCCGFEFDPTLVAAAAELPIVPQLKLCGRIEANHRLIRADGGRYRFDHHQAHETIYGSVAEPLRVEYHALLGAALESRLCAAGERGEPTEPVAGAVAFDLCDHFLKGGRGARALPYLMRALRHLQRGFLHASSLDLADRALQVPGLLSDEARLDVLNIKIAALNMLMRADEEREALKETLALVETMDDPGRAAVAYNALGNHLHLVARFDEARTWLERARQCAIEAKNATEEIQAEQILGNIDYRLGSVEDAQAHYERCIDAARAAGERGLEAGATINLGMTFAARNDLTRASELYEQGLKLARRAKHRRAEAFGCSSLGRVRMLQGHYGQALEHARHFRQLCHEIGDVRGELSAAAAVATVLGYFGALDEVAEELESAHQLARDTVDPFHTAYIVQTRAWVAEQRGNLAEAESLQREALACRAEAGDLEGTALSLLELGRVLLARGDLHGAEQSFERAAEEGSRLETPDTRVLARCYRAILDAERVEEAKALLKRHGNELGDAAAREAHYALWRATRERRYLKAARESLLDLAEQVPVVYRRSLLQNVALHREISEDWASQPTITG